MSTTTTFRSTASRRARKVELEKEEEEVVEVEEVLKQIFVNEDETPLYFYIPASHKNNIFLKNMIEKRGGKVTNKQGPNIITLCSEQSSQGPEGYSDKLISDSVKEKKLMNLDDYLLSPGKSSNQTQTDRLNSSYSSHSEGENENENSNENHSSLKQTKKRKESSSSPIQQNQSQNQDEDEDQGQGSSRNDYSQSDYESDSQSEKRLKLDEDDQEISFMLESQTQANDDKVQLLKQISNELVRLSSQPIEVVIHALYVLNGDVLKAKEYLLKGPRKFRDSVWKIEDDCMVSSPKPEEIRYIESVRGVEAVKSRLKFLLQ